MNIGFVEIAASLVAVLALVAILVATRRPAVEGKPLDPKLVLLFAIVPVAMGVRFTAAFAGEQSVGHLIMAILGWALAVWILIVAVRMSRAETRGASPQSPRVLEKTDYERRRLLVSLGFAVFGLVGIGVASLSSWVDSGVTTAWILTGILTSTVWVAAVFLMWVGMHINTNGE